METIFMCILQTSRYERMFWSLGFRSPSCVMLVVYLFSMFSVVQASNGAWNISWFPLHKGMYGTKMNFKIGKDKFCEFSPPSNSCNVTIKNMQYKGFLLWDTRAALLTPYKTEPLYLEWGENKPASPTSNETFPTREEANERLTAEVIQTPNNETSGNAEERQDANDTPYRFYRIGIPVLVVIAMIVIGICIYGPVKKRQSPKDTGSPEEAIELNVPPNTDEPQNISNGRSTENGHHHPSPSP